MQLPVNKFQGHFLLGAEQIHPECGWLIFGLTMDSASSVILDMSGGNVSNMVF